MKIKRKEYNFWFLFLPAAILVTSIIYLPLINGIQIAFKSYNLFDLSQVGFNGLDNFKNIIFDEHVSFVKILFNTFVWVVGSLIFQFLLGFILALLLKDDFFGKKIYSGFIFYPWALSGFAIGLVWSWLFNGQFGIVNDLLIKTNLINQPIGFLSDPNLAMVSVIIANVWYGVPYFAIMLLAALQTVPKEVIESSMIDGANSFQQLISITIPYIRPTIISTIMLRTLWIMNFPDIIYGMTNGGPVNATNILAIQMINKIFKQYDYGQGTAMGLIIIGILLIYTIAMLYFTSRLED